LFWVFEALLLGEKKGVEGREIDVAKIWGLLERNIGERFGVSCRF
jgi:hypothetical protein